MITIVAAVSFAATPLEEIGTKANHILALGWKPEDRGDPWVVAFRKEFAETESDPEVELRDVMGEYWLGADKIQALLDQG